MLHPDAAELEAGAASAKRGYHTFLVGNGDLMLYHGLTPGSEPSPGLLAQGEVGAA